ncbi:MULTISPECIES: hypothetical protein [unclassified Halomonas]|uniref:hypothetical protein n=1 Tax=unclassified Halomonas TaxID=2609666 RepID=UPI00209F4F8B|nr:MULTISPECIES: hypothetical protein [unclassified Halomonas]MCP1312987.1 hypothetical protein [Halomonas sp. 707D7]MCP1326166.1 hypothetical protein [Halomonas sp. 707D4]
MIGRLLNGAMPWLLAGLIGLLVFQFQYAQRLDAERQLAEAREEHERNRADILLANQRDLRRQNETLNRSLAERDRLLGEIADDMSASRTALEQLGETDADSRTWMDSPLPDGIADWVRQLQTGAARDSEPVSDRARPPYQRATGAPGDP